MEMTLILALSDAYDEDAKYIAQIADRVEASARHQFWKIQSLCQAEINSAISDHISSIFMLKVVRDIAENQLSKLSQTEGKEESNGSK